MDQDVLWEGLLGRQKSALDLLGNKESHEGQGSWGEQVTQTRTKPHEKELQGFYFCMANDVNHCDRPEEMR